MSVSDRPAKLTDGQLTSGHQREAQSKPAPIEPAHPADRRTMFSQHGKIAPEILTRAIRLVRVLDQHVRIVRSGKPTPDDPEREVTIFGGAIPCAKSEIFIKQAHIVERPPREEHIVRADGAHDRLRVELMGLSGKPVAIDELRAGRVHPADQVVAGVDQFFHEFQSSVRRIGAVVVRKCDYPGIGGTTGLPRSDEGGVTRATERNLHFGVCVFGGKASAGRGEVERSSAAHHLDVTRNGLKFDRTKKGIEPGKRLVAPICDSDKEKIQCSSNLSTPKAATSDC